MRTRTKTALALLFGATFLVVLRHFDRSPLLLPITPDEAELAGQPPAPRQQGDVLLLVDPARIDPNGQLTRFDASCAWTNLLEAEFGAYSLATPPFPDPNALEPRPRAVVVSSSALPTAAPDQLERFVLDGGVLFVDIPPAGPGEARGDRLDAFIRMGGWNQDRAPGGRDTVEFPEQDLLPVGTLSRALSRDFDQAFFARPPRLLDLRPDTGGDRSGALDQVIDAGLFAVASRGPGRVVIARTCIAALFAGMLQGVPEADLSLRERFGDYPDILEPDDLVLDPRLRQNETPFADLLAHAVAALLDPPVESAPPLPRLMWYPAGSNGVFLMTHDEDFQGGDNALRMLEWDRRLGLSGTVFAISHPRMAEDWIVTHDFVADLLKQGGSVGLHWNQYPMPRGIGPIEPVTYRMSCASQLERLTALSPALSEVRTNRNHYLILQSGWARTFRILAAQGILLDSTFGANKGKGYLFGTSRPYRILDENGLPLPLRELPFVNQEDWGGADADFFRRLLEQNGSSHKGAIVSLFHPHLVVQEDDGAWLFEQAAAAALASGHVAWNFDQMLDFWLARDRARIHSRVDPADPDRLEIELHCGRSDFLLGLPLLEDRAVSRCTLDGAPREVEFTNIAGRPFAAIALPQGSHRLSVWFESR